MSDINMGICKTCINEMTDAQKEVFLRCFAKISSVDGHFDDCEKDFIRSVAVDLAFDTVRTEDILADIHDEGIINDVVSITDRKMALELIKQLCLLAHADDELSDEETLFIGQIGQAMGLDLEKIEEISNWVIDYLIWREQGKLIFEAI